MTFKDQLNTDMQTVFLNENEFALSVMIDGMVSKGMLQTQSGSYDEGVSVLILSSNTAISTTSSVIIDGKNYSVVSVGGTEFGERRVILGDVL